MTDFSTLLQQGSANAWLFVPSAILLGVLHGLEPGHSKTMMAAFIVAVRGTLTQAILLGLSATISHTAVVWIIALGGLYFGQHWNTETSEPYFQVASAVMIIVVAMWMLWRTRQQSLGAHDHHHHAEIKEFDTAQGSVKLEIFEEGVPPRFRIYFENKNLNNLAEAQITIITQRGDGNDSNNQEFSFIQKDGFLESVQLIPEPHEFVARLSVLTKDKTNTYDVEFCEHDHHHDGEQSGSDHIDAHALAHAKDIQHRFANREVTTAQIVMFGLTGGLIPCPASITVLLLCLQLKKIALGATLVLCFSIGLALTMVTSGALAALSIKHVSKRWDGFGEFARNAPYFSGALILLVGLYVGYQGLHALQ